MNIEDYLQQQSICFFEWPEKGEGYLGTPDVILSMTSTENGRQLVIEKLSEGINIADFEPPTTSRLYD